MEFDVRMRELAARQHGVVARLAARAVGANRHHLRSRIQSGAGE